MTHGKKISKLQRRKSHRDALIKNLCKSLIEHNRIRTTLAKAKAVAPFAEKLVTLGKRALKPTGKNEQERGANVVHLNRQAFAKLRDRDLVFKLFHNIATASKDRPGGYTRITKLGQRQADSAPMAFIEWVDTFVQKEEAVEPEAAAEVDVKPKKAPKAKKAKAEKADKA
ncbi:MAG: 50S ribosomal protein L17 [Verrucomicrobia bacterium]|nr:50S ribosomal protein L17 [Verrucomicrobiota bacterium]